MRLSLGRLSGPGSPERRRVLAEVHRDPVEPSSDPDDLAGGAQGIEFGRLVAGHAAPQHVRLPERHGQRERL